MKKISAIVLAASILAVSAGIVAHAEEGTSSPLKDRFEKNKELRNERIEDRKDFRASTTAQLKDMRGEVKDMRRDIRATTTAMFKEFKDQKREIVQKMRKDIFQTRKDALVKELLDALAFVGFGRVEVALGVGGDAVHAVELAGLPAAQVMGLELSSQMHAVTVRRLGERSDLVPRVQATAAKMPFAARSFDTVIATFPAPYILEPDTLAECARVLQGGGRLAIAGLWVRLHNASLRRSVPLFYADPPDAVLAQVAQLVETAGFQVKWENATVGWADIPILVAELP